MKYLDQMAAERVEDKKERLSQAVVDRHTKSKLQRDLQLNFTYSSMRVEGVHLTFGEIVALMGGGLELANASLRDQMLVVNHANAFRFLGRVRNRPLSVEDMLELHGALLWGVAGDAGSLRFQDPSAVEKIGAALKALQAAEGYHVLEKAALIQAFLHRVRPFNYGVGPTSRLMAKWLLDNHGYPLGLYLSDRDVRLYRRAAERAGQGEVYPLANLMAVLVERTLDRILGVVERLGLETVDSYMEQKGLSFDQVFNRIKRGELKAYRSGDQIYVREAEALGGVEPFEPVALPWGSQGG